MPDTAQSIIDETPLIRVFSCYNAPIVICLLVLFIHHLTHLERESTHKKTSNPMHA